MIHGVRFGSDDFSNGIESTHHAIKLQRHCDMHARASLVPARDSFSDSPRPGCISSSPCRRRPRLRYAAFAMRPSLADARTDRREHILCAFLDRPKTADRRFGSTPQVVQQCFHGVITSYKRLSRQVVPMANSARKIVVRGFHTGTLSIPLPAVDRIDSAKTTGKHHRAS